MTPRQSKIYNQIIKVEEMSENAFLMAWDDYFSDNPVNSCSIFGFAMWLLV